MTIDNDDFGTIAICAIRYCQGRQTYMPSTVQKILKPFLPRLSDKDLTVMLEDCEHQRKCELYGDPVIDKPEWIRWKESLEAEKKRRA